MAQKTEKDKKEEPEFDFDEEAPDFEMEEEIPLFEEAGESPVEEGPPGGSKVIDIGDIDYDITGGQECPSVIDMEEGPPLDEGPGSEPFEAAGEAHDVHVLGFDEPGGATEDEDAPAFAVEGPEDMDALPFAEAEEAPVVNEPSFEAPPGGAEESPFLEGGDEFPGFEEAGEGFPFGGSEGSGDVGDIIEKVSRIENKITHCDMGLTTIKEMDSLISEKAGEIDKHIQELLSIYELVTNEINPFVERFELKPKRIKKIIKRKKAATISPGMERGAIEIKGSVEGMAPSAQASTVSMEGPITRAVAREVNLLSIGDDPGSIAVLLRWLKFLLEKVGRDGLMEVLMHYEDTGWIGPEVRNKVIKYAKGILSRDAVDHAPMDVKDHMISLYFITMLQGLDIDPRLYSSIYTDLAAMDIVD